MSMELLSELREAIVIACKADNMDRWRYVLARFDIYTPSFREVVQRDSVADNPPAPVSEGVLAEHVERLVVALRSFSQAYPVGIFPEMTASERAVIQENYPGAIDRISAGMGRHCAKFMAEAADAIEHAYAQAQLAQGKERGEWRPIESAPRDGGFVLVAEQNGNVKIESAAFIRHMLEVEKGFKWFTGWQPLPSPPSQHEGEGNG